MRSAFRSLAIPLAASLIAIVIGAFIALGIGFNPLIVYGSLLSGAFGNWYNVGYTLSVATPLILTGLGIAVAFRAGLFNIGAEGQYWMGAASAVWVGYHFASLAGWLHILVSLLAAMVVGGLWAGVIPGLTKAFVGAHEVITTMMMSYIGIDLARFLIEDGPMRQKGYTPQSPQTVPSTWLATLIPGTPLTVGLIFALVAVVLTYFILSRTTFGFQIRAVGYNQRASRYAGIRVAWYTILSLGLSGVLAGLAGGVQMLAVEHRLSDGFSSGYGFTGIVVALLARSNPFGVVLSAVFFAALSTGGQNMQQVSGLPASLTDVLTGLIVFFVAAERLIPMLLDFVRKRWIKSPAKASTEGRR